jgi:beta-phosphoglucomutase-like phosphatase (HAD superfamily)
VASGSSLAYIQRALELTDLVAPFDGNLFSASMVSRPKPAPDLFLYAAAAMGVEPQDCVVVEDSPSGIAAARAAGMFVIGFTGGSHLEADVVRADYLAAGCGAVLKSMAELGRYLGGFEA